MKGQGVACRRERRARLRARRRLVRQKHITGKLQAKAANGATGLSEKEILQATRAIWFAPS